MKGWTKRALAALAVTTSAIAAAPAQAQDYLIGDIVTVGFTFCPRGFLEADGRLLAISTNTALFSLYGTTYGGNGQTTFALPDLRGRFAVNNGQGPGLSPKTLGEVAGTESVTLTSLNLPAHIHAGLLKAYPYLGNSNSPVGNFPATGTLNAYQTTNGANFFNGATVEVGPAGSSQPVEIQSPFLTLRHCVAVEGIFPSRN